MKRLIALAVLSAGFAIGTTGCAHHQLTKQRAKEAALGTAMIAAVVAAAMLMPCSECENISIASPAARNALPPR